MTDIKNFYEVCASQNIPKWRVMNKNDLCNLYIQNEYDEKLSQSYLSAIICRYIPAANRYKQRCLVPCSEYDAFDLLYDAITYALSNRKWLDPQSSVYNDPNGPDKCINRKLKHLFINYEFSFTRDKRSVWFNQESVEKIQTDMGDSVQEDASKEIEYISDSSSDINDFISNLFQSGEYFKAYIVYAIVYCNVYRKNKFNVQALYKAFYHFDEKECANFSKLTGINFYKVVEHMNEIKSLNVISLKNRINIYLSDIKEDVSCFVR